MTKFKEIGLNSDIQKSLEELGYIEATPIQEQAIPFILNSKTDLIGLAQTGTGKTAAFSLPILHQINPKKDLQAIVLCPTRELCLQITKEIKGFAKYSDGVDVIPVYGGARIETQISQIRAGANIVVGTPGRVHDLIRRKILKLQTIEWLVLDEADEMLDMGFKDDLDAVLDETSSEKQVLLFSATMSQSVRAIAEKYMQKPEEISVGKRNVATDQVTHEYCVVQPRDRYEALRRIVDSVPDVYGILFCRTRRETQEVADKLKEDHYSTEALHGDVSQTMRTQIMDRFRKKQVQLLVATDVAARGIDVNDLTHVINYNLPDSFETYVHRSGRTGRAQKTGISISILTGREARSVRELERITGKKFIQKPVPTGKEICEKQLFSMVEKMKAIPVDEKQIKEFLPAVNEMLDGLTRDELIARFVLAEFNHFLSLYKDAKDLRPDTIAASGSRGGSRGGDRRGSSRGGRSRSGEGKTNSRKIYTRSSEGERGFERSSYKKRDDDRGGYKKDGGRGYKKNSEESAPKKYGNQAKGKVLSYSEYKKTEKFRKKK